MRILGFTSVFAAVVAAASAWHPARAHACSCLASPIYKHSADPRDGATNVPVNFAPVIEGSFEPGSITVEDELGQRVDVTIHEGHAAGGCPGTWAEIIPQQPWSVHTAYIIRVKPRSPAQSTADDSQLRFVTGSDSLPESELAVPEARLSTLTDLPDLGSCGPIKAKTCLNVEGQTEERRDVEVIARRGDELLLRTLLPINDADYGFAELPDCLELRRRSPTGARSKPLMLCGDELHVKKYEQRGNKPDWPRCEDGTFTPEAGPEDGDRPSGEPLDTSSSGAAGSPPSAADGDEPNTDGPAAPNHHAYGCSAMQGRPGTAGPLAWIVAALFFRAVRRRKRLSP